MRSGAVITVPAAGLALDQRPTAAAPRLRRNPFRLGVASGDPRPGSVVIWTRLATHPLAADGRGGMPRRTYHVRYQVATDPGFRQVIRDSTAPAGPDWGHSVRAVITGLAAGREYWYRWRLHGHVSAVGRTVTAPGPTLMPAQLRIAQMCCSNYAAGYFTACRRAAEDQPDLVIHLGDYIYENGPRADDTRLVAGDKCRTLADFRLRYAQTRTDPDIRAAQAAAPWLVTADDHEVENNYFGSDPGPALRTLMANAYRAWFENQPVRRFCRPQDHTIRMHRSIAWGALANLHLLDTRQHKDARVCGPVGDCEEGADPSRSMLGEQQTAWLADGLAQSPHRWDVLAQQLFFGRRFVDDGIDYGYMADTWDGYRYNQQQVVDMCGPSDAGPGPRNAVVLTGDTHAAWLSDVKADWDDPGSATVATEIGCTSISSGRDGYDSDGTHPFMAENPHIRWHNNLRGYCLLTIRPDELAVDYRVLDSVVTRGAPVWTRAGFVIPDREAAAVLVQDAQPPPTSDRVRRAPRDPARATVRQETGLDP